MSEEKQESLDDNIEIIEEDGAEDSIEESHEEPEEGLEEGQEGESEESSESEEVVGEDDGILETDLLKQYELDEESIEDAFDNYKKSKLSVTQLKQMDDALAARGLTRQDLISGNIPQPPQQTRQEQVQQPETGETYFEQTPFANSLKNMDGQFNADEQGQKNKASYQAFAKFADSAMTPVIKQMESLYIGALQNILSNREGLRNIQWQTLNHPGKNRVSRDQFFSTMDTYQMNDTEKVMNFLAVSNPELLKDMVTNAEKKGIEKGKRKVRKSKNMRKGKIKSQGHSKYDFKKYMTNGDWDDKKIDSLGASAAVDMLDEYDRLNPHK